MSQAQPNPSTSTSPEEVDPTQLMYDHIGRTIKLVGRDITLGHYEGPLIHHTGELHSLRMLDKRIVVTLLMPTRGRDFRSPRIIEMPIP